MSLGEQAGLSMLVFWQHVAFSPKCGACSEGFAGISAFVLVRGFFRLALQNPKS